VVLRGEDGNGWCNGQWASAEQRATDRYALPVPNRNKRWRNTPMQQAQQSSASSGCSGTAIEAQLRLRRRSRAGRYESAESVLRTGGRCCQPPVLPRATPRGGAG